MLLAMPLLVLAGCATSKTTNENTDRVPSSVAGSINMYGAFSSPHEVDVAYPTRAGCKDSGGRWENTMNGHMCIFKTSDDIHVSQKNGAPYVTVSVSGRNAHECDFEGVGEVVSGNRIEAHLSDVEDGQCRIQVTYENSNKVSLNTEDRCSCPSGTSLIIDEAIRTKKFIAK